MPHRPSREVEALVAGRHGDPFAFLGMHKASAGVYVRAMLPDADRMAVIDTASGEIVAQGERIHPAGFFVASMPDRNAPFRYRLRVWRGGHWHDFDDIYRFPPVLGELDVHLLVEGNHLASYQKLGAHAVLHDGVEGVAFAVWAPNAQRVSLVGDFNAWDGRRMPMRKRHAGGFWELFVPGLRPGHLYKYELLGAHGELLPLKADPHAERAGLGLWLDWVPGHFPTDAHGLGRFDGTALYEHADPRQGLHRDWNTLIYNYGRREVTNFLLSSALYWMREYHIDGLRVDAVASMLYLDYSRNAGEWIPNLFGGRENLDAVAFLRRMNELVFGEQTGATTAAEESTAWPMVSRPVYVGGLGFGFKWNMGWMHDTLRYMSMDPIHRKYHHNDMTFGLLYAFHENFILPLSHDEVVHGKGSLLGRMPGDRWQRFANLRAYFAFMWTHPGKKLLFMGGEFGQEHEWNHDTGLEWQALNDPFHAGVHSLVRDLNRLYRATPALHRLDCDPEGFAWIDAANGAESGLFYVRRGREPHELAIIVCNFTPVPRHDYRIGVPRPGHYRERINTDAQLYGGSGIGNAGAVEADPHPMHGHAHSLCLQLPPLGVLIFTAEP